MKLISFRNHTIFIVLSLFSEACGFSQPPRKHGTVPIPKIIDNELPGNGAYRIISTYADQSLVVYREMDNGDATLKRLYRINQRGNILRKSPLFSGEYVSYGKNSAFFIWGAEFGSIERYAHLWNAITGEDIRIDQDGNSIRGGVFGDGDGFWIQYYIKDSGLDAIKIVVYGVDGRVSVSKIFQRAGVFEYVKGKARYTVRISKPEFPY